MFFKEHGVPHFHARYGDRIAVFTVDPLEPIRGELPRRADRLVREWAGLHRAELMRNWARARGAATRADRPTSMSEIHDIVNVEVMAEFGLRVTFDDGAVRELNLEGQLEGPVFEPLRDPALFTQATVDPESGTVVWPTGAGLDPIVVYEGLPPLNAKTSA